MARRIQLTASAYTIGIIYVKPLEMNAITVMLDEKHKSVPLAHEDDNEYTLGKIGDHNVAIAGPPRGEQGKAATASFVGRIRLTFKNIRVGLLVGIGGGVPHLPKHDVRLGDVVVGAPECSPAVVQYDLGKQNSCGIEVTRTLNRPPPRLLNVVNIVDNNYQIAEEGKKDYFTTHLQRFSKLPRMRKLYKHPRLPDKLFLADYDHEDGTDCSSHDPRYEVKRPARDPQDEIRVHYSTILSGDLVMKSGRIRDQLSAKFHNALCFEMEAAGLMDVFPCLVIRGICDYSDSHKNKDWQQYAAATAASYARQILLTMAERGVGRLRGSQDGLPEVDRTLPNSVSHRSSRSLEAPNLLEQRGRAISNVVDKIGKILIEIGGALQLHTDVIVLFYLLESFKISSPNLDAFLDPTEHSTEFLRKHCTRFFYILSQCCRVFFQELKDIFGVHFIVFFCILSQCCSQIPKLLTGAHIAFEDVFGEEMFLSYSEFRNWGLFNRFLERHFENSCGQPYVARGQFMLYDYQDSIIKKQQWYKLAPNSKVTMSIVEKQRDPNVCGYCFKEEHGTKPGIRVKCSCGRNYSHLKPSNENLEPDMTRITKNTEISENLRTEIAKTNQSGQFRLRSSLKSIASELGFNPDLANFTRVDFQAESNSQSLCSLIEELGKLVTWMSQLIREQAYREPMFPKRLPLTQDSIRSCSERIRNVIGHEFFEYLDNIELRLRYRIDEEACWNVRKQRNQLRHEAAWMYLEPQIKGISYGRLEQLFYGCAVSLKALEESLESTNPARRQRPQLPPIWRWICCRCGGDNSGLTDYGCATCNNHWRDRSCSLYDANAR